MKSKWPPIAQGLLNRARSNMGSGTRITKAIEKPKKTRNSLVTALSAGALNILGVNNVVNYNGWAPDVEATERNLDEVERYYWSYGTFMPSGGRINLPYNKWSALSNILSQAIGSYASCDDEANIRMIFAYMYVRRKLKGI